MTRTEVRQVLRELGKQWPKKALTPDLVELWHLHLGDLPLSVGMQAATVILSGSGRSAGSIPFFPTVGEYMQVARPLLSAHLARDKTLEDLPTRIMPPEYSEKMAEWARTTRERLAEVIE